jgi:multidrug efflux pump subunit AcrB
MGITEKAVKNPAGVAVAVAIITLFGLFSLAKLPVQLFPDIELPQLNVQANWRAASPREIESEILEPMEEVLQGLPGMQVMEANAFAGGAFINADLVLRPETTRYFRPADGLCAAGRGHHQTQD